MKLDIFTNLWLDIVFEGRNKSYGAYELRKENPKTSVKALVIGSIVFSLLVSAPLIASFLPDFGKDDEDTNIKVVLTDIKRVEKKKEEIKPLEKPKPKTDVVKFVKPVVAKSEDVTEEPPKVEDLKDKTVGKEDIKGDPDADLQPIQPAGEGPDDNEVYSSAGLEVQPEFPGGLASFYKYVGKNYTYPEGEEINGKVIVSFVVEKDGSLTDIKVLRDLGYGTGAEAIRVLKKMPKWSPGEQNGRKVRCSYNLPIVLQSAAE